MLSELHSNAYIVVRLVPTVNSARIAGLGSAQMVLADKSRRSSENAQGVENLSRATFHVQKRDWQLLE